MNKNKHIYKYLFILFLITIVTLSFILLKNIFVKDSGLLVSSKELDIIKNSFTQEGILNGSSLELSEIQGNKKFLNLKFKHPSLNGHYYTYYALYDTKKDNLITNLEFNKNSINIKTAQFIGQLNNNVFAIIDNNGILYSLKFVTSKEYKINELAKLNISKNDIQDIMLVDNNLYILTREYTNNFNEKTLSSGIAYKIEFDKKYKNVTINNVELEEDTIPVKLIFNNNKSVGYITIDTLDIPVEYGKTYSTNDDHDYLNKIASRNNKYRLFKADSYKVTFFDNSNLEIKDDEYFVEKTSFSTKVNKDYNVQTGSVFGVPIFIDSTKNKVILIEDYLHNVINYHSAPKDCLIYSLNNNDVDYGKYNANFLGIVPSFHKNYVGFIYTDIGTIGISKDGSYTRLTNKGIATLNKKTIIYEINNSICFAKTV